jgi:hypothetical protein
VSVASTALGDASAGERAGASERMALGRWLRTTPGLIRVSSLVAVGCMAVTLVLGATAVAQRGEAVDSVSTSSVTQLATAGDLYASLAAADATATSALLRAGSEPEAIRERYLAELDRAESLLVEVSEGSDRSAATQQAVRAIETGLSGYVARVETARSNRRFENPVSAAYMRAASAQMRDEILPAATTIWSDAALRLGDDYAAGTSIAGIASFATAGGIALVALLGLSALVAWRTRRLLNVGVLVATILLVAVGGAALILMAEQHEALDQARVEGSDPLLLVSAASFVALQVQADVNLALAERETRTAYLTELDELTARVGGAGVQPGLLADAREMVDGIDEERAAERADAARALASVDGSFDAYLDKAQTVLASDEVDHDRAVRTALDERPGGLGFSAAVLNEHMDTALDGSRERVADAVDSTDVDPDVVVLGLAVALIAAGACALLGAQKRIGEYR